MQAMKLKSTEIAATMNTLGSMGTPFLFIIDFEGTEAEIITLNDLPSSGILFQAGTLGNSGANPYPTKPFHFTRIPISEEKYRWAFDVVMDHLQFGNTYLLNLTFPTQLATDLTLPEIFHRSQARFKLLLPDRFVVFSPEIFVRILDGHISSFPMKGTIDADLPDAANRILNDPKERAEHYTIVDLIRNDLGRVATRVRVESFRYIERIETHDKTLLQVSSHISGDLPAGYQNSLGDIFMNLIPAGSISGAPKRKTLEIIRQAESLPRGYFTGVFGVFDGRNLESGVMIRFIEQGPHGLVFRSGGGITAQSDWKSEYREMIQKVYVPFI